MVARNEPRLKELSARLTKETGRSVTPLRADLGDTTDLAKVKNDRLSLWAINLQSTSPDEQSRDLEMFPTLTADQMSRIAAHGRVRRVEHGEILVEAGEQTSRLFVVTTGQIQTAAMSGTAKEIVAVFQPGMFTGEVTMLSGRRGLAQIRATQSSEVIEIA